MNLNKKTMTITVSERHLFNVEMAKILEKYSNEEIKKALQQIKKSPHESI